MMSMVHLVFKVLLYISYFSIVVPLFFLFRERYILRFRQYQLLGILFLVSAIADAVGYILIRNQIPNHAVNNLYFLVSFVVLSLIYTHLVDGVRMAIYSLIAVCLCLFIWDTFCVQSIVGVQSYLLTFCCVLSIGYSIIYYDHLLDTIPARDIMRVPFFWVNTAIAYYFSLNLFIFIFSTYIFESLKDEEILVVWSFHNLNNIIRNILFAVGVSRVRNEI